MREEAHTQMKYFRTNSASAFSSISCSRSSAASKCSTNFLSWRAVRCKKCANEMHRSHDMIRLSYFCFFDSFVNSLQFLLLIVHAATTGAIELYRVALQLGLLE